MNNKIVIGEGSKLEMILRSAIKYPGVKVDRTSFLKKELSKFHSENVVRKAIMFNPAQADISIKEIDRIAKSCINYEAIQTSAISAAAGLPGGFAMAATIPADTVQLFAHILRILQKLAYLYGWQDMFASEDGLDDETSNRLILFIGVMAGVNAANGALAKIALLMAENVPKRLMREALTKGTIYPIVKSVAKVVGVKMTKPIFTKAVGKAIPIVGAATSGGITYVIFKPMAKRLKKYLETLRLADVDHYKDSQDNSNIIDIGDY